MSETDIYTGERWAAEIEHHLQQANFGIICLTPENLNAPWLLFEAGALSKWVERSYVVPYLHDLGPVDVTPPLSLFQGTVASKSGTQRLLNTIQLALGEARLDQNILDETFEARWHDLDDLLSSITEPPVTTVKEQRSQPEILGELLVLVRALAWNRLASPIDAAGDRRKHFEVDDLVEVTQGRHRRKIGVINELRYRRDGKLYCVVDAGEEVIEVLEDHLDLSIN